METSNYRRFQLSLVLGIAAVLIVIGGLLLGALHEASARANQRRVICMDLEGVKAALRADEAEQWAQLPENLKLLKIVPTPELMERFANEHKRKLARYAPRNCK